MLVWDLIDPNGTSIRLASSRFVPLARLDTSIKTSASCIKLLSISPLSLGIQLMFDCISLETHPKLIHVWEQLLHYNNRVFLVIHIYQLIIMCIIYIICSIFHQLSIHIFSSISVSISISRHTRFTILLLLIFISYWNAKKIGHLSVIHWCND